MSKTCLIFLYRHACENKFLRLRKAIKSTSSWSTFCGCQFPLFSQKLSSRYGFYVPAERCKFNCIHTAFLDIHHRKSYDNAIKFRGELIYPLSNVSVWMTTQIISIRLVAPDTEYNPCKSKKNLFNQLDYFTDIHSIQFSLLN